MKVSFTDRAERDLEDILDFIAKDAPIRAESFVRELQESALLIGETPRAFPVVGAFRSSAVRRRVHGAYLIFYRIVSGGVEILTVAHGARGSSRP